MSRMECLKRMDRNSRTNKTSGFVNLTHLHNVVGGWTPASLGHMLKRPWARHRTMPTDASIGVCMCANVVESIV